ncbi:MAG: hypothetical protein JSW66_09555 [Phycisphaerales bacterium]|nr:MAG: hypothetical protein JSW66_09555 [Phycisphaerales bacterium]
MAQYLARLSVILSQGKQVNRILVIGPTTAWVYQGDSTRAAHLNEIGNGFQQMLMALERAQVQ